MVSLAEDFIARNSEPRMLVTRWREPEPIAAVAPIVRGACSQKDEKIEGAWRRLVLDFRGGDTILSALQSDLACLAEGGVVTPDHTIRTKNWPLVLPHPDAGKLDGFAQAAREAAGAFVGRYRDYFARHNKRAGGAKQELDPLPRVVAGAGPGPVWSGPHQTRRRHRRRHCRRMDGGRRRCRAHRPLRVDFRGRHVRLRILAARASQARSAQGAAARRPNRCRHRAPPAQSAAPPPRHSLPPERKLRCST